MALVFLCSFLVACGPAPPTPRGVQDRPTALPPADSGPQPTLQATPTSLIIPTVTAENAGGEAPPSLEPRSTDGELRVALREHIRTLNPYLTSNASESFVVSLLYDTLADADAQGNLQPNLAQRWELSASGTKLTCWLHPEARWHSGQKVTAEDVVFTFNLIRQTALPGLARIAALVGQVQAVGSAEVQFTLLRPGLDAVRRVCSEVPIVPAFQWQSVGDPLAYDNLDSPIGSGPFALLERTAGGGLVLANTGMHHSTRPSPDGLVIEIINDEEQALKALQEGKFDLLGWDITRTMARQVQDHPERYGEIQVAFAAGLSVHSLLFNLRRAPYDNPALRSALAQAIDTQQIVDQVLLGLAERGAGGLFPPASPWYDSSSSVPPFDAQQAMEELTRAGFVDADGNGLRENPDGSGLRITITCANSADALKVARLVADYWKAVGIEAKVSALPAEQIRSVLMQASFEVVLRELALREPEEAFLHFHSSRGMLGAGGQVAGYNCGGYASAKYDRVAEEMLDEQDREKRLGLLHELQRILATDLPQIPLYSPHIVHLYRDSRFAGWRPEPGLGLLSRATIANLVLR